VYFEFTQSEQSNFTIFALILVQEFIKQAIEKALSAEQVKPQVELAGCLISYANGYIPTEQAIEQAWQEAI
jgi:hypothetical protein